MALNKDKVEKDLIIELEKNYLLQRACNKLGLTRSTVYRWMQEDQEFEAKIRSAQVIGRHTMSDYVESKLMKNIESGEQRSIEFWLKSNNGHYRSTEKALARQVGALKDKLKESRAALAAVDGGRLLSRFIDREKAEAYYHSPEQKEAEMVRKGIYSGQNPREREILEQVKKVLRQMEIAKHITKVDDIPDEQVELVD